MSQTEPALTPADAARQQLQQLQGESSQLLAQLMLAQQHKLSQMVRQLQNPPAPATASADVVPAATSGSAENTAEEQATLAGVLQLQRDNMGNLDLLLQRIHATMQRALVTAGSAQEAYMKTKPVQLFEAVKTADGAYECQLVSVAATDEQAAPAPHDDAAADPAAQQAFFIDANLMQAVLPDWAVEAQAVFLQSLHSNATGGHTAYFQQVHARFEQMRQSLQQQLDQFSRFG